MEHDFHREFGWILIVLAMGMLPGCGTWPVTAPADPIRTFLLGGETPSEIHAAGSNEKKAGTLLVNPPTAQSGFSTQRMAYVNRDHEVQYFSVNQWADTPARMLHPLLVDMLERTNLWNSVVQMPSAARGDFQLSSEHLVLQQEFTQQPSQVRLHLRLQLMRLHDYRVVATREFTIVENSPGDDPYGGVQAANIAVGTLLKQTADWLSLCMIDPAAPRC